nr:uncharacterized protein LOC110549462 [Meriones unguiculatus]
MGPLSLLETGETEALRVPLEMLPRSPVLEMMKQSDQEELREREREQPLTLQRQKFTAPARRLSQLLPQPQRGQPHGRFLFGDEGKPNIPQPLQRTEEKLSPRNRKRWPWELGGWSLGPRASCSCLPPHHQPWGPLSGYFYSTDENPQCTEEKVKVIPASGPLQQQLSRLLPFLKMSCLLHVCIPHVCLVPAEVVRERQIPWNRSYGQFRATALVLRTKPGSSARTANAPNH